MDETPSNHQEQGYAGIPSALGAMTRRERRLIVAFRALDESHRDWLLETVHAFVELSSKVRGGSGVSPPPLDTPMLSARQREIVNLIARGKTNREIADILGVAESTVKNHLRVLFAKLGVTNRAKIAMIALNHDSAIGADGC
jgi:DNA-binding NarL/FixJ family response regulator